MLRVLIADDEPLAQKELSHLLAQHPDVRVVGAASDAREVLQHLERTSVDLILLDIHMPGVTGLELAKYLREYARSTQVVFVTAHDEFAVDAFELSASDYLLKPVRPERLQQALLKVRRNLVRKTDDETTDARQDTISVQQGGVTKLVRTSDILYVTAQGDYSQIHVRGNHYLVRVTLSALEERWKEQGFLRIHRSCLVNLNVVDEVELASGGSLVRIKNIELPVSRRHTQAVRSELAKMRNPEHSEQREE